MSDILKYENNEVESKIILIRNQHVIIDSDVAELYGVQTREINQAVRNNPDKFPFGYVFELEDKEIESLRSKKMILKKSGRGGNILNIYPKPSPKKAFICSQPF